MFSKELIQGVLKEIKNTPSHARDVIKSSSYVHPHRKYWYGKQRYQYICYFETQKKQAIKPVIVFLHGGSWMVGKPEMFTDRARVFIQEGYPVFMPTHRRLPFHWYPSIREDLVAIFKLLPTLMQKEGLGGRPIILGGMSSGGNLAALSFFDTGILQDAGISSGQILGGLFCGAPLNLKDMPDSIIIRAYAGERSKQIFQWASPISHLQATHDKPVMVVHGEEDGLVSYKSILAFNKRLEERTQCSLTTHTIANGSHIDSVRWAGSDIVVRKAILAWLQQLG